MPAFYNSTVYPLQDASNLLAGFTMVISATAVNIRVFRGSKNKFAYTLMSLTYMMGIANIGWACTELFSVWTKRQQVTEASSDLLESKKTQYY